MKRIIFMLALCAVFLCGCQTTGSSGASSYGEEFSKAQEIRIASAEDPDDIENLTDDGEISDFITALDLESWSLESPPQDAEVLGTFVLSQEETVKLGETESDGELYDICKLYAYRESPYITMEIEGFEMDFKISDGAAEYLSGYFE